MTKQDKGWKGFGNHNIGNYQPQSTYPTEFEELLFVFKYSSIIVEVVLTKGMVNAYSGGANPETIMNGWYASSTNYGYVDVTFNATKFSPHGFGVNGSSVAANAICSVYYR